MESHTTTIEIADDDSETKEWKEQASKLQNEYYRTYLDKVWWSGMPAMSRDDLCLAIAKVLFGRPLVEGVNDLRRAGYARKEVYKIRNIATRITRHFTNCQWSVVLVCLKLKKISTTVSVFRVWDDNKQKFIDSEGRVYPDWDAFLRENIYKPSLLCYPKNGRYVMSIRDIVQVDFCLTPAANNRRYRIYLIMDSVAILISLIAIIMFIISISTGVSIFYIIGLIFIVVGLPWRVTRAVIVTKDVWKHR
ncbi:hypothetical protein B566_EDAN004320 [Ephemera danica]|nr:hypothetical protein B566_EDAN004320 [Ephemera danica]